MNIKLGDPAVVAQCPDVSVKGSVPWGRYQFPEIETTAEGFLHVSFHISSDSALAYGNSQGHALSRDGGAVWTACEKDAGYTGGSALKNGGRVRVRHRPALDPGKLTLPAAPDAQTTGYGEARNVYFADRFGGDFNSWSMEYKPAGGEWALITRPAELPHAAARYISEGVMPTNMIWRVRVAPDGAVWGLSYPYFIDGYEKRTVSQPVFLVSDDCCGGFRFRGTIPYRPQPQADPLFASRAGFTEPDVAFLPDGSIACLMRTDDRSGGAPLYICFSGDGGRSFCAPQVFDRVGVWPSLAVLPCGVTLAAYGRPGVFLRLSSDPSGRVWEKPITVLDPTLESCCYTGLVATGDRSAVLVYSHFTYPDENGVTHKTILSRSVEIE